MILIKNSISQRPLFLLIALSLLHMAWPAFLSIPARAQNNSAQNNNFNDNPALRLQRDIARQQSAQNLVDRLNDLSGPYDGRTFINRRLGNGVDISQLSPLYEYDYNGDNLVDVNEAVRHSRENFSKFDMDKNGTITQRDIENFYKNISRAGVSFGQHTPKSLAQSAYSAMANQDTNGDGKIEFSEYAASNARLMAGFDLDNNGIVTRDESLYAPQAKLQQAIDRINATPIPKSAIAQAYSQNPPTQNTTPPSNQISAPSQYLPRYSAELVEKYPFLKDLNDPNRFDNQSLTPEQADQIRQRFGALLPESTRKIFDQTIAERTNTAPAKAATPPQNTQPRPGITNRTAPGTAKGTATSPSSNAAKPPATIKGIAPQDNKKYTPKPIVIP